MRIRTKIEMELKIEKRKLEFIENEIEIGKQQIGKTHEENELLDTWWQLKFQEEKLIKAYEELLKCED